jgi:hypothetical protein
MEYVVHPRPQVRRRISQWGLSDYLLVELYLLLAEGLAADPPRYLQPDPSDPDAPHRCHVELVDPDDPRFVHTFIFQVRFDPDVPDVFIVQGSYLRNLKQ